MSKGALAFIRLGLALASLGLTGCAAPIGRVGLLRLAPQSSALFQCGPTTLAAVLAFHGTVVPEDIISRAIYSPTAHGVLLTDLAWFARSQGYQTELRTGTSEDLQRAVAAGRPPIVLLDLGLGAIRQPHFTALTGWGEEGVHCQGTGANGTLVAEPKFIRQWERAGKQYLLITPAS